MKKIFFIGGSFDGCYYYRCELPIRHMRKFKAWGDIDMKTVKRRQDPYTIDFLLSADAIVMQRPNDLQRALLAYNLYQKGKKIVFENDDTFDIDPDSPASHFPHNRDVYYNVLKNAHLATTTTEYLAKEFREFNKNVKVIPNCIDFDDYPEPIENDTGKIRIGFVGSVVYLENSRNFRPVIDWLLEKENVQIVVFGVSSKAFKKKNPKVKKILSPHETFWRKMRKVEFQEFVMMKDYPKTLASLKLDIMLIPRKDNKFNRCKSNVKWLEASALKIPVVAQKFPTGDSPYEKDIKDGETGFLADKTDEWKEKIQKLLDSGELRKEMGEKANRYVKEHYDIKKNIHLWEETYQELFPKTNVISLQNLWKSLVSPFKGT